MSSLRVFDPYFKLFGEKDAACRPLEEAGLVRILCAVKKGRRHCVYARHGGRLEPECDRSGRHYVFFKVKWLFLYHYVAHVPGKTVGPPVEPGCLRLVVLALYFWRTRDKPARGRYRAGL